MAELRRVAMSAVGEAGIKRLFKSLLEMACQDDNLEAARLILLYSAGRPAKEPVDPDSCDRDELERLRARPGLDGPDGVLRFLRSRSLGVLIAAVAKIDEARAAGREGDPIAQLLNEVAFRRLPDDELEGDDS
jgi:hypothetical protein